MEILGCFLEHRLKFVVIACLLCVGLIGCSKEGTEGKSVTAEEMREVQQKNLAPGDQEKIDQMRRDAQLPGGAER